MSESFEDKVELDTADAEAGWQRLTEAAETYAEASGQASSTTEEAAQAAEQFTEQVEAAAEATQQLASANEEAAASASDEADAMDRGNESLARKIAKYQLYLYAIRRVAQAVAESVKAAAEQEKQNALLEGALRSTGDAAVGLADGLELEAHAMQQATGFRQEAIESVQRLLLEMGVAPAQLDRVTKATMDLAAGTGIDLTNAALALGKVEDGVATALQRHGIVLEKTTDKSKLFEQALEQINEKFGGQAEKQYEGANKAITGLGNAWHDLTKEVGEAIVDFGEVTHILPAIESAFEGLANLLHGDADKIAADTAQKHIAIVKGELDSELSMRRQLLQDIINGTKQADDWQLAETNRLITQLQAEYDKLTGAKIKPPPLPPTQEQLDAAKRHMREMTDLMARGSDELIQMQVDEDDKLAKEQQRSDDAASKALQKKLHADLEQVKKADQEFTSWVDKLAQQSRDSTHKFMDELVKAQEESDRKVLVEIKRTVAQAESIGGQLITFAIDGFAQQLLANQQYTDQYNALTDKRTQADLKSMGIQKSLAEISKERQDEEHNDRLKALSDILANIAEQATVKALFTTAEAIAASVYAPNTAAQLWAAAAAYWGTAAAAGVGAVAVSSSRGMTTQEANTLQGLQQQTTDTTGGTSVSKHSGSGTSTKQSADTIINVYQLGIAGATRAQQAEELAQIQKQYDKRKMGG